MKTEHPDIGPLLTVKEVAERIRASTWFVNDLCLKGALRSIKIGTDVGKKGGKRLIPEVEVNTWVARKLRAA